MIQWLYNHVNDDNNYIVYVINNKYKEEQWHKLPAWNGSTKKDF